MINERRVEVTQPLWGHETDGFERECPAKKTSRGVGGKLRVGQGSPRVEIIDLKKTVQKKGQHTRGGGVGGGCKKGGGG